MLLHLETDPVGVRCLDDVVSCMVYTLGRLRILALGNMGGSSRIRVIKITSFESLLFCRSINFESIYIAICSQKSMISNSFPSVPGSKLQLFNAPFKKAASFLQDTPGFQSMTQAKMCITWEMISTKSSYTRHTAVRLYYYTHRHTEYVR